MVFYRKYRPQKIAELDLEEIRKNLKVVLSAKEVPHAFLFTGPKGLGKTSAARIIAKSVNCQKNEGRGEPCGRCTICLAITQGSSLDVLEIDAASNRGIDEIRDLREKIKLAPTISRFKVYIIDEAHMLTPEAFNALLKTLEEPPAHALFVLCTTEPHKLPPTVISRCVRFDFKKGNFGEIKRALERVVRAEKLIVEKEALAEIAQKSEGSFRDAVKILEQTAFLGGKITKEKVTQILGLQRETVPQRLLELLAQKKTREALLELKRVADEGENWRLYTESLLETLRKILLKRVGVEEEVEDVPQIKDTSQIERLLTLFSRAYQELKTAAIPQLPLELAVVEWCEEKFPSTSEVEGPPADPAGGDTSEVKAQGKNLTEVLAVWPQILSAAKLHNHTLAAVLRGCRSQDFHDGTLTITAFYQFHKERLEHGKTREVLENIVSKLLGKKVKIKYTLSKKEAKNA